MNNPGEPVLDLSRVVVLNAVDTAVLLDREGPDDIRRVIKEHVKADDDNHIVDLHLWAVGPNIYSVLISLVTHHPEPPEHYKALIPPGLGVVHVVVEVHPCDEEGLPIPVRSAF